MLSELINYDYEQTFEDRRTEKVITPGLTDCAADAGEGNGALTTLREFLYPGFFKEIELLKTFGDPDKVRVVLSFSS